MSIQQKILLRLVWPLTFEPLTPKLIGFTYYLCSLVLPRLSLPNETCMSWRRFTEIAEGLVARDYYLWCISVWSLTSVKQRVLKILSGQNIPISSVNWPWPLTYWPQNPQGSSSTHHQPTSDERFSRYWANIVWSTDRHTDRRDRCKAICPFSSIEGEGDKNLLGNH
jgi:hypothetical protein